MTDLVVTVPREIWVEWIAEGDPAGSTESGEDWGFYLGWQRPPIDVGDRLYIVAHDRLRGYAPVTRVSFYADVCPEHSLAQHLSTDAPTQEEMAKRRDEAIECGDDETALLCMDALDRDQPLLHRMRCWAIVAHIAGSGKRDPACEWCLAELGVSTRPRDISGRWAIGRRGGAQAVTIGPEHSVEHRAGHDLAYIRGFRGFRKRWWPREDEFAFNDWKTRDLWLNRAEARTKTAAAKAKRAAKKTVDAERQGSLPGLDQGSNS